MSIKRHHTEWLSLVEVSGPFLTMPVLEKVFPQGLDAHDPDHFGFLRAAYDEWEDNQNGQRPSPAIHTAWITFVLTQTLGLPDEVLAEGQKIPQTIKATVAEHGETLRPDFVVRNPDGAADAGKARLLVQTYPCKQELEKPVAGKHWKASPATRMMEFLHQLQVNPDNKIRLGLVTNGEHWMLVDAPRGETTGFASWYGSLWLEEKITLQAFRSLVGVRRFFNVAADETLEKMLKESANYQNEVTDQLGLQVRRAVEVLIQSLDRADQDHGRSLLAEVPETVLYEAALTVMMRLVFLFCAEERGLLLLGDPLFDQHYAVSTLVAQLQEAADQHGEEVLERRLDAWVRLLSTFRAVYGGVQHERMKLPAYSGNLFNPDRFMFLEGRKPGTSWRNTPANPLPVNNRTVLHLLRSLQYLEMQGEARRLSFRALDIEQIGHVYEGLLDHTAKRAAEPILGLLGAKGREKEMGVKELETRMASRGASALGVSDDLIEFLHEETGKSESALRNALEKKVEGDDASRLQTACGNEDALFKRVLPFANLIRTDSFGKPVVIRKGSVYVTEGTDRRSSGTHYTPKSLTEPIVKYTLEPLVYDGPTAGKPKEEWKLRSATGLLNLKICDMACGSAAFLVQTCRYLSELVVEAWENAEAKHPGVPGITPEGTASTGAPGEVLIPKDADERLVYARRIVAQRCLYGVDKNPLAVEMAKLSLWLFTLAKDKPFTFLDHAIRCGDSLVGIQDMKQLEAFNLEPEGAQAVWYSGPVTTLAKEAVDLRNTIEAMTSNTVEDVEAQARLLAEAEEKTARLRYAADLLISVEFQAVNPKDNDSLHDSMAIQAGYYVEKENLEEFRAVVRKAMNGQPTFHWPLEFPEVIVERGGFDAFVGNPPFMGGKKIRGRLGERYLAFMMQWIGRGQRGSPDLCAFFFLRAYASLNLRGTLGLLATNTIAQGGTRKVGLDQIVLWGGRIFRTAPSRPWPGDASLEVAIVHFSKAPWDGTYSLEETPGLWSCHEDITSHLTAGSRSTSRPFPLAANNRRSFIGSYVLGLGFVLEPNEAQRLITRHRANRQVVFPYLNGDDLNATPTQTATRWIICFFDWPLDRTAQGCWGNASDHDRATWLKIGSVPSDYPAKVAGDFPDCLRLVEDRVKPERMKNRDNGARKWWWRFARPRPDLYSTIAGAEEVLVIAQTSRTQSPIFVPNGTIFDQKIVVFSDRDYSTFATLCSTIHYSWVIHYGCTMRTDAVYTPSDCFDTFPFPSNMRLDAIGLTYHQYRSKTMLAQNDGLTATYNRFHDTDETAADIQQLRELHVEMDLVVAAAYGWDDLALAHGFHETNKGVRYTISEAARREVLGRLLKLNHERYAEEVRKGLHEKKKPRNTRKTRKKKEGGKGMFG
jgi:hypothetical protein